MAQAKSIHIEAAVAANCSRARPHQPSGTKPFTISGPGPRAHTPKTGSNISQGSSIKGAHRLWPVLCRNNECWIRVKDERDTTATPAATTSALPSASPPLRLNLMEGFEAKSVEDPDVHGRKMHPKPAHPEHSDSGGSWQLQPRRCETPQLAQPRK